ncbi:sperm-specific sodium:proton exchanger, partial [Aphomia sociella]
NPHGHVCHTKMSPTITLVLVFFTTINCQTDGSNQTSSYQDNITFDDPSRPTLAYPTSLGFLFIFTTLLLGAVIRAVMLWTSMCLPYRVVMFALGGLAGFCANRCPAFKPFVDICFLDVDVLLITFLPIIVFSTSYSVDSHSFWRSFPQILLVGVPGALLTALMVGFMAYYLIESSWNFPTAILFGVVCSPIFPVEVVKQLKEMSKGKYISVLLLGEGLIGDTTVMIEFTAVFGYLALAVTDTSQIALLLLRFTGGGILLGIVMGKIAGTLLSITYYDVLCVITVTLAVAYLTYYIGEKFLYVSGLLATVIVGVIVSYRKSTVAGDVEQIVSSFWTVLAHEASTLVFTMVGVVIFEKVSYVITVRQVSLVFVTYMTIYCSRLLVYAAMMPVLRRVGYGMTWQHCMACVWGGLRGPLSLCLALIVLQTPSVADAGEIFIIQTAGIVLLSLLINATTMYKVLKVLGLAEISLAKKANMTNCVKRIMLTRDRCISMLKMDKFLADANWDLVQEGTTIKHPYQLQISGRDEDSEDDTYMGYRYTTCPDCEREIPNEPTKKEFAEMMREANQRVLKAMKISYWRQYEHGKISKDGVRTLVQAVEVAADSNDGRVNLDQLGTLWKPKAHAVWLRHRLVNMMTPEAANAQVPHDAWRQQCYRVVTNVWFDGFIYLMILCNTPVILCEVALRAPVTLTITYTIKSLNLVFYLVYVLEMIIKMLAFGVFGYFKSHWNKLDFFIIVMATGDLVLDIVDALTPWDKWKNLNSSVLTATKLLRMLRFLRLCKLARVSVPKIMAYIDRMIDIQLAYGYDVGKGFVTGEQEVCNLLPQLVDNKLIQENLNATLEADRLAVTRQLGLLQRDRPWTAITVKTRQATTSTLNIMILDAMQLKEEGFLDEMEYRLLVNAIQEKVQMCRHKGSLVAPSSPETQLRAVSWLQGNERVADYFLENSDIHNYNYNDILISRGDEPKGMYILVSGLLEATYTPPDGDVGEAIPNYEFLTDLKFGEPSQDYIVSGNAVGVLGVLTNRPYSYTVRCDSAVQAYYVTMPVIREAFNLSPHPIMGLEAAMWREIGIKLSMMVLPSVPAYHGWSAERLSMRLEHAFVPCLKAFKVFVVNELMEDIVLLDGICQDMATREVFQPPCYIPRTAHRLVFPKSSQLIVSSSCPETKLLIIPAKDTDELDIMEDELDDVQCELISNVSSRCLYHKVVRKLSNDSRGPNRRTRNKRRRGALKRVNYRDSVWGKQISTPNIVSTQSEKELNSKFYKPSNIDVPEKLEPSKSKGELKTMGPLKSNLQPSPTTSMRNQRSEQEIYNTVLTKSKKSSFESRQNIPKD